MWSSVNDDRPGCCQDRLAEGGRLHSPTALGAFEQCLPEVPLQAVDLGDQGRLFDTEDLGCRTHRGMARRCHKALESLPGTGAGESVAQDLWSAGRGAGIRAQPPMRVSDLTCQSQIRVTAAIAWPSLVRLGHHPERASRNRV